jgi:hypothetical protein
MISLRFRFGQQYADTNGKKISEARNMKRCCKHFVNMEVGNVPFARRNRPYAARFMGDEAAKMAAARPVFAAMAGCGYKAFQIPEYGQKLTPASIPLRQRLREVPGTRLAA